MAEGNWLPVRQAASLLGYTEQGLRKRIATRPEEVRHREEIRGNKKRLLVWVDAQPEAHPERNAAAELTELRGRVEQLERLVSAKDAHLVELQAALAVERQRVDRLLAERQPARPPWPGLKAWWQRVWEGG